MAAVEHRVVVAPHHSRHSRHAVHDSSAAAGTMKCPIWCHSKAFNASQHRTWRVQEGIMHAPPAPKVGGSECSHPAVSTAPAWSCLNLECQLAG